MLFIFLVKCRERNDCFTEYEGVLGYRIQAGSPNRELEMDEEKNIADTMKNLYDVDYVLDKVNPPKKYWNK